MKKIIYDALNAYLIGEKTWKDFSSLFSRVYFDDNYLQEIEDLSDKEAEFFGEINDCIEYTDNSSSDEDRRKYGLMNENEVRGRMIKIVKKYQIKALD